VNSSQKGGLARARILSPERRSEIARTAARVRWPKGILSRSEIQRQIADSLQGRRVEAYLFGSYGRGKATPLSDVDIMVLFKDPGERADLVTEGLCPGIRVMTRNSGQRVELPGRFMHIDNIQDRRTMASRSCRQRMS
jgi:hypothetical protein